MATKPRHRNRLGAPRHIDPGGGSQPGRLDRQRFQALPQHFAALAERCGRHLFQHPAVAWLRRGSRHQPHHRGGDLGLRHERGRRNVEQDFGLGAPVRQHAEPSIGFVVFTRDDAFGHLALKHQHHHVVPWRPRLDGQPVDQKRGRDVVGQVGDDFCLGAAEQRTRIERLRVGADNLEPSRIMFRNFLQRAQRAFVALDGDDAPRAERQQGAGQSARAGADLDDCRIFQRAGGAGDPRGQIEVEQEVLSERFAGRQRMLTNDLAQRRQVVDRAHAGCARHPGGQPQRRDQARRIGPAGAGDVEGGAVIGRGANERQPQRDVDGVVERQRLDRDQRLVVIHADRAVIGFARGFVEHGVGRQRPPDLDALAAQDFDGRRHDALLLGAERAVFAGMGLRPDIARRGLAMPKRAFRSAATMRAVVTIRSADSCAIASRSERWMVTGTTASAGDHSIITGCGASAAVRGQFGEKFGMAGMPKSGAVEHALGDRIGDDRAGPSGDDIADRLADRGDGRVRAGVIGLARAAPSPHGRSPPPAARPRMQRAHPRR